MLDAFTVGRKAAKFGYKKLGIPGAIIAGAGGAAGYVLFKKKAKSAVKDEVMADQTGDSIGENGLGADTSGDEGVDIPIRADTSVDSLVDHVDDDSADDAGDESPGQRS